MADSTVPEESLLSNLPGVRNLRNEIADVAHGLEGLTAVRMETDQKSAEIYRACFAKGFWSILFNMAVEEQGWQSRLRWIEQEFREAIADELAATEAEAKAQSGKGAKETGVFVSKRDMNLIKGIHKRLEDVAGTADTLTMAMDSGGAVDFQTLPHALKLLAGNIGDLMERWPAAFEFGTKRA